VNFTNLTYDQLYFYLGAAQPSGRLNSGCQKQRTRAKHEGFPNKSGGLIIKTEAEHLNLGPEQN